MAQDQVVDHEPVKLMSVDRQVVASGVLPTIFLIYLHTHQVGHHRAQSLIVIALDPHHFDGPLWIGELADVAEEFPMLFG
jgi:hypothetical protein